MILNKFDEQLFAGFVVFSKRDSFAISVFLNKMSAVMPEINESLIRNCIYFQIKGNNIFLSEEGKAKRFLIYRKVYVLAQFAKKQLKLSEEDTLVYVLNSIAIVDEYLLERFCILSGHVQADGPKGECCVIAERTDFEKIIPLADLTVNSLATITYIKKDKGVMPMRLQAMGVFPGVQVKLKQIFPAYILEIESEIIALERELARSIFVRLTR